MQRYVAIVGPSAPADPEVLALAEELGRLMGARGHVVVTGGLGGVMAAAVRGAHGRRAPPSRCFRATTAPTPRPATPWWSRPASARCATRSWSAPPTSSSRSAGAGDAVEVALAVRTGVPVLSLRGWDLDALPGPGEAASGVVACATAVQEGGTDRRGPDLRRRGVG